ncbi:MAG: YdiU family protein [Pseudomonadota bacterium]|nr:YdiU family protein [Pseudomonadota bacterium]
MQIDNRYARLDPRLYHRQPPLALSNPIAGHFNPLVAAQLDWPTDWDWVAILAGQVVPAEFEPLAMAYAGHQFGHWAGQLGDGRGLLLAQVVDQTGSLTDLHLKGAGLTPYSRMGDGRAVLRSTIREYLAGHALNCLGIPASNALGFVSSDTPVQRETLERGAALLRVADSHIRLGHFEWINRFAPELLQPFTDHVIDNYYPECKTAESPYLAFAALVIERTAKMIADWQLVGFAHGVMNTDNLSITGSTLDFGPYGFMERFVPDWINNHSDHDGRYAYQNQPSIAHWNLWVWLGQLLRLGVEKADLQNVLSDFEPAFLDHYHHGMAAKLGLSAEQEGVFDLGMQFLNLLKAEKLDYTNSFRQLAGQWQTLRDDCIDVAAFDSFAVRYQALIEQQGDHAERRQAMDQVNPRYILRNHMAQTAIEQAEAGDFSEVDRLFWLLAKPFDSQPERETLADRQPPAADQPLVEVSCSS